MRSLLCLALTGCWCDPGIIDVARHEPPPSPTPVQVTVDGVTGDEAGEGCATFVGNLCEHDLVAKGWTDAAGRWWSLEYRCPPGRGMVDVPGCVEEQYSALTGLSTWCGP